MLYGHCKRNYFSLNKFNWGGWSGNNQHKIIFNSMKIISFIGWKANPSTMRAISRELHILILFPTVKLILWYYFHTTHCTFWVLSNIGNMRITIWPAAFQSMSDHISQHTCHMLYQNTLNSPWHSSTQNHPRPWHKPPFTHTSLYTLWHPSKNTSLLTCNTLMHSSTDTS